MSKPKPRPRHDDIERDARGDVTVEPGSRSPCCRSNGCGYLLRDGYRVSQRYQRINGWGANPDRSHRRVTDPVYVCKCGAVAFIGELMAATGSARPSADWLKRLREGRFGKPHAPENVPGDVFGFLVLRGPAEPHKKRGKRWYCDCSVCGRANFVCFQDDLRQGRVTSCGCLAAENRREWGRRHARRRPSGNPF